MVETHWLPRCEKTGKKGLAIAPKHDNERFRYISISYLYLLISIKNIISHSLKYENELSVIFDIVFEVGFLPHLMQLFLTL